MPVSRIAICCAVLVLGSAAPVGADTLPPSVRACIGMADAGQRLACYDREVARLIAPADTFGQGPIVAVPPASVAAATPAPPPPAAPAHVTAKVTAVHQAGDDLIVTLDNGSVWEQAAPATSQLNLQSGDVVHLDRELGGWFLSNRYGDNLKVRLRQPDGR